MRKRDREYYDLELSKLQTASQTDNARMLVIEQQLAELRLELETLANQLQSVLVPTSDIPTPEAPVKSTKRTPKKAL
jgi:hypothetical protein